MKKHLLVSVALAAAFLLAVPQAAYADGGGDAYAPESEETGVRHQPECGEDLLVGALCAAQDGEADGRDGEEGVLDCAGSVGVVSRADGESHSEASPLDESDRDAFSLAIDGEDGGLRATGELGQGAEALSRDWAAAAGAGQLPSGSPVGLQAEIEGAQVAGEVAPSSAAESAPVVEAPALAYRAYESGAGKWQGQKDAGEKAGGKSVQAVKVKFDAGSYGGGIAYKVRIKGSGWSKGWKSSGAVAGKTGKARTLTGLKVKLTGEVSQTYDVVYRVRDKKAGWQAWTFNGRTAAAKSGIASFWIKLKKHGSAKKVSEGAYYVTLASAPKVALEDPKASAAKGAQMRSAGAEAKAAQKFYVRDEGSGLMSLQVVASGLFLGAAGGKVVQLADAAVAAQRWKAVWNDGISLVNEASGEVLSLSGGSAKKGAPATVAADEAGAAQRWMLSKATLVSNGYYRVRSAAGTYLDVKDGSYGIGANVDARSRNSTGAQVFRIAEKSGGSYYIQNARSFLVVGVKGASKANKANVVQQAKSGAASQLWKPVLSRSGSIAFKNGKSGKALEVAGSSKKSGANVRQGKVTGAVGQRWQLVEAKRYSLSGNETLDRNVARVLRTHSTLRSAYDWTVAHPYREGQRYYSNPHVLPDSRTIALANDFFKYDSGNCYRYAAAFNWLARGLGYKARVISGWVQARGGGRAPHGWVEVVQGKSTYVCDPDMQHELSSYNWYMRTYATSPIEYHSW